MPERQRREDVGERHLPPLHGDRDAEVEPVGAGVGGGGGHRDRELVPDLAVLRRRRRSARRGPPRRRRARAAPRRRTRRCRARAAGPGPARRPAEPEAQPVDGEVVQAAEERLLRRRVPELARRAADGRGRRGRPCRRRRRTTPSARSSACSAVNAARRTRTGGPMRGGTKAAVGRGHPAHLGEARGEACPEAVDRVGRDRDGGVVERGRPDRSGHRRVEAGQRQAARGRGEVLRPRDGDDAVGLVPAQERDRPGVVVRAVGRRRTAGPGGSRGTRARSAPGVVGTGGDVEGQRGASRDGGGARGGDGRAGGAARRRRPRRAATTAGGSRSS